LKLRNREIENKAYGRLLDYYAGAMHIDQSELRRGQQQQQQQRVRSARMLE